MCGIAGYWSARETPDLHGIVEGMTSALLHRGPDDDGCWFDKHHALGVGFRRLAIIDLSPDGHQPMISSSGRTVMVFNGEIYNYQALRTMLQDEGVVFRGQSDSEVALEAIERWGAFAAVRRFVGMFAIATWSVDTGRLTLIRDRLGIKPLFVSHHNGVVSFASELKSLMTTSSFDRSIDGAALEAFLRYLYVPAPRTIFRHCAKLMPGHILEITDPAQPSPPSRAYWDVADIARQGLSVPFEGDDREAVEEMERVVGEAVRMRMRADVPLGALLSGGVDSSTVVALMQEATSDPVKTFTIAFDSEEHNEADHAALVAKHLGTCHTEMMVTGREALDVIPSLATMFDEPFADPSQVPTYLVSKLARSQVTVALSGDGADEILGGYNRYISGARMLPRLSRVPRFARRLAGAGIHALSPGWWDRAYRLAEPLMPDRTRQRLPAEKIRKLGDVLKSDSTPAMYRSLMSAWQHPASIVGTNGAADELTDTAPLGPDPADFVDWAMLSDQISYLPDDLLAKVDRASMAVALEVRVPLIDHRVVEFSWRLPQHMKIRNGTSKWILRQLLYARVPREIIDRPKTGFSVPIDRWLRGPLRAWGESLVDASSLETGPLRSGPVRKAWNAFQRGAPGGLGLWAVLMFESWRKQWSVAALPVGSPTDGVNDE